MTLIAGRVCAAVGGKNATGVNPTPAGTKAAAIAWTGDWEAEENNDPPPTVNIKYKILRLYIQISGNDIIRLYSVCFEKFTL